MLSLLERESEDDDFDLLESLSASATEDGWNRRLQESVELLESQDQTKRWGRAIAVCYWAITRVDMENLDKMGLVARLYWNLMHLPDSESGDDLDNLVWSIAKELKDVSYESEWDPMRDPEVQARMATMG